MIYFVYCVYIAFYCVNKQSELEETLHRLELDNAKLEASLSHQTQKAELLQKELNEANKVYYIHSLYVVCCVELL